MAPTKPDEVEYKDIVDKVKDHLNPKPSCIVQRFRFNCRSRSDGETIGAFIAELRSLAEDCEFGETLHDMLRDRLVCGVNNARIQKRLLQETNLKFEVALKIARAMETADKCTDHFQSLSKVRTTRYTRQAVVTARLNRSVFAAWERTHPATAVLKQPNAGSAKRLGMWPEPARAKRRRVKPTK